MIHTHDLTKTFGDMTAVDGLTLDIAEGEVFGFLGPNGAGKTTTVRLLCCLIAPTSGSASLLGLQVGRDDQAIRRQVGILTETPGLYDRLSAWRNLEIYARLYEIERVDYQVEKYLRLLGLWERRDDAAGEFSKGMRQKLAIGRALLHEPRVVFLDEPTAALDPEAAKLVRDFIAELKSEGRTIFLCTHNLDEADRLCDRVAVFKTRLRVVDTPANLRRQLYGQTVTIELAGDAAPYVPTLAALSSVENVTHDGGRLLLQVIDPPADNPAIVRLLVEAGAGIRSVSETSHSLEDVYLQLIQGADDEKDRG
jgi:ABC-2 type transport system ATP-binding protein